MKNNFYRENPGDSVEWLDDPETIGEFCFRVKNGKVYNLFRDYPEKLTEEELAIFNKENPYWVEFFKDRVRK